MSDIGPSWSSCTLNEDILFWLTISYQKPFVFSVSVFCFQICTLKLNLLPKIGLAYSSSVVKWFFLNFLLRKYFLLFFAEFELLMFHNNIVKISEKLNKKNLLKICSQVTYLTDFCIICIHFYNGKKWKYLGFFKNQLLELNFLSLGSYDKWFCIKSWQKFANLLLLCKAPSKKRLSERCWKHSNFFPSINLIHPIPGIQEV